MADYRLRILAVALLALAGCGSLTGKDGLFRDRADEYRQARELPPLAVPQGLDGDRIQAFYVIPPGQQAALPQAAFEVPRPEPLGNAADEQAVRIQKLGDEQWALVNLAPDQVWPLVKAFLDSNRVALASENGAQGLLVTDWLQVEGQARQEQYLIRIDAGVQRNTTELQVRQRLAGPGPANAGTWQPASDDGKREYGMLYQLSTYLASQSREASVSLLAQGIRTASKVSLQQDNGVPYLLLELPPERAWAAVGTAIGKSDLDLLDQDHSAGQYFVALRDSGEGPGWWARLFGARKKPRPAVGEPGAWHFTIRILDNSRVRIDLDGNTPDELDVGRKVRYLNLLKGHIS